MKKVSGLGIKTEEIEYREAISNFAEFDHILASEYPLSSSVPMMVRLSAQKLKLTTRHVLPVLESGSPGTHTGNFGKYHEPTHQSHGTAWLGRTMEARIM